MKAAFRFRLRLTWLSKVESRSGRTKPITMLGNKHCDWFILPILLPTPTYRAFSRDTASAMLVSQTFPVGILFSLDRQQSGDNGNVLILPNPILSPLWLLLRFFFFLLLSLGHRRQLHCLWKPDWSVLSYYIDPLMLILAGLLIANKIIEFCIHFIVDS